MKRTLRVRHLVACFVLLFSVSTLLAADDPLQITVESSGIDVSHATPSGKVVIYAVLLDGRRGVLLHRRVIRAVTADSAGQARYDADAPLPLRSICVAVDVESGRLAWGGPAGYEVQVQPFPTSRLKREFDGTSGLADAEITRAGLLIVRPRTGAWHIAASEGGGGDADEKRDGKLSIDFSAAQPVYGDAPPPSRLKKRDVVVLIDSTHLELFTTEIDQ